MKITHIKASNILGVRCADVPVQRPVLLIAGPNGNGKSSIREAVGMALDHAIMLRETATKRDLSALVHDGEKTGLVELEIAGRESPLFVVLPAGKVPGEDDYTPSPAMQFLTRPESLAALPESERRAFLFGLTGCRVKPAEVADMLTARGVEAARAKRVMPLLRAGFADAAEEAKKNAAESRGAWKTLTGEAYGDVKAGKWVAKKPEGDVPDEDLVRQLKDQERQAAEAHDAAAADLAALVAQQEQAQRVADRIKELEPLANVERALGKLKADEGMLAQSLAALQEGERAAAGKPKRVGLVHNLARAVGGLLEGGMAPPDVAEPAREALASYEAEHGPLDAGGAEPDPEALQRLPALRQGHDLMQRSVTNAKAAHERAVQAAGELAALKTAAAEAPTASAISQARERMAACASAKIAAEQRAREALQALSQAAAADDLTARAGEHHADVQAWARVAELLAPNGIPAEILAAAMAPFNERLQQSAADTGWPQVVVHQDMRITYGLRPYRLLCESEKWRCDAMLAEAVSHVSGLRLLLLDRFDVLDLPGRSDLIGWLDTLAANGEIDTAVVFGTLKALPSGLPDTVQTEWISAGNVGIVNAEWPEAA